MDLNANYPLNLHIKEYLGNFSQHNNEPEYKFSKTGEKKSRPLPRDVTAADHLGPGWYPADSSYPTTKKIVGPHGWTQPGEIRCGYLTRSMSPRSSTFPGEERAPYMLRHLKHAPKTSPTSYFEGQNGPRLGVKSHEQPLPSWTISKTLSEGGRPLPRERTAADHLGPGWYDKKSKKDFEQLGARKEAKLLRAARISKEVERAGKCPLHHAQYGHIFKSMKSALSARSLTNPKGLTQSAPTLSTAHH